MNTASFSLCKELYELSGWDDTYLTYHADAEGHYSEPIHSLLFSHTPIDYGNRYPAYDLGYLLCKLPPQVYVKKEYDASPDKTPVYYRALYDTIDEKYGQQYFWLGAETPEDALCQLAIALFKSIWRA